MQLCRLRRTGERHQVLPRQGNRVGRIEPPGKPDILESVGLLRPASEFPGRLAQRDVHPRLRLELLQKRLAALVGIGLGEGELRVQVEERRRCGGLGRELVEKARDARRLEVQLGVDPADEVGGGLEAERGAGEGALLLLVHSDEVDGAVIAEGIPGGESQDIRRGHREEPPLLESGGDLCRALSEEGVGIEEGDLSEVVRDRVVDTPDELPPPDEQLLAPVRSCKALRVSVERSPPPVAS